MPDPNMNHDKNINYHTNGILSNTAIGYDKLEIQDILQENKEYMERYRQGGELADVTVLIHYKELTINSLIQSILTQSVQPKYIWIICASNQSKQEIERKLKLYTDSRFQIKYYPYQMINKVMLVKDTPWLLKSILDISTEYTWILEPYSLPSQHYLYYTYGLIQSNEFKNTLVGDDTSLILPSSTIQCQQSTAVEKSHHVDMIHGSWLLRTSWIRVLKQDVNKATGNLPLAYFISLTLKYQIGISSVVIPSFFNLIESPSCQYLSKHQFQSTYPSVLEQGQMIKERSTSMALLLDNLEHATALVPLICKLNKKQFKVHIILANGLKRLDFHHLSYCASNIGMVHELTSHNYNTQVDYIVPILRLLDLIQPKVIVQIKDSSYYHALYTMTKLKQITLIGLPVNQVNHALWISELSLEALSHWNDIKIDLVTITDRRPKSLERLLHSINSGNYLGDSEIELIINMDQTSDDETQELVQTFDFKHGHKKLRHRIRKGGLVPAIVESWYPNNDDNYGLILEDDIELSPLFYIWSKYNILKYRYDSGQAAYQMVYGVSLYSPRNLELLPEGRRPFNPEPILEMGGYSNRSPYGSQIPCSWGAVYFPQHWREFHSYLNERLDKQDKKGYYNITVPNSRSERWNKSWKKYFIELTYLRGYVMVYPNYQHFESFSTNHLETGTHFSKKKRTKSRIDQFKVPLIQQDILNQLPNQRLPSFENLPLMDLWGKIRTLDELNETGSSWHQQISACERVVGTFNPKDILCPFQVNIVQ